MNQALKIIVVILAFAGIFLAGSVTGGVVTALVSKGRFVRFQREREEEQARHQAEQQKRQVEQRQFNQIINALRQQVQQQQQQAQLQLQRQQLQQLQMQRPGARGLPTPEQFGPQLMQRFTNQIRPPLTPDERNTIRPLVNQAAEDLRRLRRDEAHNAEVMLEHLQDQISAVLTPVQRDRFGSMIQKWRDDFQKYNQQLQEIQAQQRMLERQMQQRRQQQMQQQPPQQKAPAGSPPSPAPAAAPPPGPPPPAPQTGPAG